MQVTLLCFYVFLNLAIWKQFVYNSTMFCFHLIYTPSMDNLGDFGLKPTTISTPGITVLLLQLLFYIYTIILNSIYNNICILLSTPISTLLLLYTVTIDIEIYRYNRYIDIIDIEIGDCDQSYNSSNISMGFPRLIILQS